MSISRRSFLRGAGALMALPFLESFPGARALGQAATTAAKPPLRMGIFTVVGGTVRESWRLPKAGPLPAKLPSILRPLEFARDDLLLVTGLGHGGKKVNLNDHEHCAFMHLTGAAEVKKAAGKPVAAESVDQRAARAVGEQTYLPSIEMGLSNSETRFSYRGPEQNVPYEANPRLVFERMFRGRRPVVPNWSKRATALQQDVASSSRADSLQRSVIDLVMEDAAGVRTQLGKADQRRLDEYLHGVRSIEKRIDFVEARQRQDAIDALNPANAHLRLPTDLPPEGTPLWKITQPVERDPGRHADYIKLMGELMVLAFQTDTTRVCTFACGSDECMFPGVVTVGYERHMHTLEHQGNSGGVDNADPIAREGCRQIHAWYTALFAEVVRRMKAIPEGDGTLLDNCMLLYTSYMADGNHGRVDYPAMFVGNAGGTLRGGRQVDYDPGTPVSNLYVEMLDRMGVKADDGFGESHHSPRAAYGGRLPGLL